MCCTTNVALFASQLLLRGFVCAPCQWGCLPRPARGCVGGWQCSTAATGDGFPAVLVVRRSLDCASAGDCCFFCNPNPLSRNVGYFGSPSLPAGPRAAKRSQPRDRRYSCNDDERRACSTLGSVKSRETSSGRRSSSVDQARGEALGWRLLSLLSHFLLTRSARRTQSRVNP